MSAGGMRTSSLAVTEMFVLIRFNDRRYRTCHSVSMDKREGSRKHTGEVESLKHWKIESNSIHQNTKYQAAMLTWGFGAEPPDL